MRLTRKKSIKLCISLWTWLALTGKDKQDWPKWDEYMAIDYITNFCWFCHYTVLRNNGHIKCAICPYHKKYGHCNTNQPELTYYYKWCDAKTPRTRKKYAKLFLEQIRTLE